MIIHCGKRRIKSYRYGWKIEAQKLNKKTGEMYWEEDRPAWPATLAQACEMVAERELADHEGDIAPPELSGALRRAAGQVREYMRLAREAA